MRFPTVQLLFVFASIFFNPIAAATNALGLGFSDAAEHALQLEFGEETWNRIVLKSCSVWSCLSIIPAIPCMVACGPNPLCILTCASGVDVCGCLGCLPDVITNILKKAGICSTDAALLKAKKELGVAMTETETKRLEAEMKAPTTNT
ncbi:hypothetical protein FRB97_003582 [Tulasnella sp. 331]|nr:hypothetical protein FRB97_003582 [Tulasnella sp. 331]